MQIREGTEVRTTDGEKAGEVDRIVLDPASKEVTHLVVRKGILFKTEKVIPMSAVGPSTQDTVTVWQMADEIEDFPDFREEDYVAAHVNAYADRQEGPPPTWARPLFPYPPFVLPRRLTAYNVYGVPEYVTWEQKNIPEGTVALEVDARVFGSDGERIGEIARVFVDSESEEATHMLVSSGLVVEARKMVPVSWINRMREARVDLSVASDVVRNLPDFEGE